MAFMIAKQSRIHSFWIICGLLLVVAIGLVAFLGHVPKARQGLTIAYLKATGSLPDVSWSDLYRMTAKDRHYNLPDLATDPNPYAVITNPYAGSDDLAAGGALFQSHCSVCHGSNGVGATGGPRLQQRHMIQGDSPWALFRTITLGIRGTAMPPNGSLPWADRWRVVAYVTSLTLRAEVPGELEAASKLPALDPVTYDEIRAGTQAQDRWLTYSGSYDGHRFSNADQIKPTNVSMLRLLWMRQYDVSDRSIETSPLVIAGYMFVTVPPNRVEALDAKTGALIWAYDRHLPDKISLCCGSGNRGLAVLDKTLFLGTLDAHLVALDLETGKVMWDVEIADYREDYSITGAPLALKNIVVTGVAGGDYGVRGFVDARDAVTGKELWRFYTIPGPGQPGSDTWSGDSLKTGGGPTWLTGSFDPETNLIYWPTGNPSPEFNGDRRSGDNLYTNCLLALDADTGALRWYFQFTPHDLYDWDATQIPVLLDTNVEGKPRHYLAQANRNAFYYLLDRDTGRFQLARPYSPQTWAERIDAQGRPVVNPAAVPTERGTTVYPGSGGATTYQSPSYDPRTGYIYISALDWGGVFYKEPYQHRLGELFLGGNFQFFADVQPQGAVRALNALTGEQVWEYRNPAYHVGGLVSTAGGVVFGSQQESFFALDAATGRELWRVPTSGRLVASPISFLCSGKQMVTIAAGHDLLTFGL